MPFESQSQYQAEAFESRTQVDAGSVVSMDDWSQYSSSNTDSGKQSDALVGDGTLPKMSFYSDEPESSSETPSSAALDAAFRNMAGGDRELSEAEFFGSLTESQDPCSPYSETMEMLSGVADISDDGKVNQYESSMTFDAMDKDGSRSVTLSELGEYLRNLGVGASTSADGRGSDEPLEGDGGGDCSGGCEEDGGGYEEGGGGCEEDGGGCEEDGGGYEEDGGGYEEDGGGYEEGGGGYEEGGGGYEGSDAPPQHAPIEGGGPLEGGMGVVTIAGDGIPPELAKYAHMEGDTLVIDAQGEQLPPLNINRDKVVIKNARINGAGADSGIHITGSHVQVLSSEITGGYAGITAERASDVTVDGNYIHDFDGGSAVVFNGVDGGAISNNKVGGYFPGDAINMLGSSNLKVMYNDMNVTVDGMGAPLMVEDGGFGFNTHSHDIEVAGNKITYSGGVPPGLLGGYNLSGHDNVVNGDTSAGAWQLYHYQSENASFPSVWYDIYYNGQRVA